MLKISFPILFLICHLSFSADSPSNQASGNSWKPVISTLEGQIRFWLPFILKHSSTLSKERVYRDDLFSIIKPVHNLLKDLDDAAQNAEVSEMPRYSFQFQPQGEEFFYKEEEIQKLSRNLEVELEKFKKNTLKEYVFQNLFKDAEFFLKTKDEAQVKRLFKLAPLLYDFKGLPLFTNAEEINTTQASKKTGLEFDTLYNDLWKNHLKPHIDLHAKKSFNKHILQLLDMHKAQFIDRQVSPALKLYSANLGQIKQKNLTLEELPPLYAIIRSVFSGDCSMQTIPYYPLLKGVRVFAIRKSSSFVGQPDGYVLSALATLESGEKIPYIITVNGSFNVFETQAITLATVKLHGTTKFIVPDFKNGFNEMVVNSKTAIQGLTFKAGVSFKSFQLPKGWNFLSKNTISSGDYYSAEYLKKAILVNYETLPANDTVLVSMKTEDPELSYIEDIQLAKLTILERALLAVQLVSQSKPGRKSTLFKKLVTELKLQSEEHLKVIQDLEKVSFAKPISGKLFKRLEELYGFQLSDLKKIKIIPRIASLKRIYKDLPDLQSKQEWKNLAQSYENELRNSAPANDPNETIKAQKQLAGIGGFEIGNPILLNYKFSDSQSLKEAKEVFNLLAFSNDPKVQDIAMSELPMLFYYHGIDFAEVALPFLSQQRTWSVEVWNALVGILSNNSAQDLHAIFELLATQSEWPEKITNSIEFMLKEDELFQRDDYYELEVSEAVIINFFKALQNQKKLSPTIFSFLKKLLKVGIYPSNLEENVRNILFKSPDPCEATISPPSSEK